MACCSKVNSFWEIRIEKIKYDIICFSYGGDGPSNFALLPINQQTNFPEENGAQTASIDGHGPNKDRQEHSHCHQVQFNGDYLYVNDLGTDTVNIYNYNNTTGALRLNGDRIQTKPGAGPRHLLFHPDKPLAFVVNELDSTTNVYRTDVKAGKLELQQTITTRREDAEKRMYFKNYKKETIERYFCFHLDAKKENTPAEIHFSPDKNYLLVSNRGDDNIVIYNLNTNTNEQILSIKEHIDIQGSGPRYFTFDPTGQFLLVTNQDSNNLTCFQYKKDKGTLEFISQLANIESPQHLVFLA